MQRDDNIDTKLSFHRLKINEQKGSQRFEGEDQSRTEPQKSSPFLRLPSGLSPPHMRRLFQSTLSEQGGKGVQRRWGGGGLWGRSLAAGFTPGPWPSGLGVQKPMGQTAWASGDFSGN